MSKRILVIAPLLFLFVAPVIAQDLDQYIELAESSYDNSEKLVLLDSVLSKSFRKNPDVFIKYSLLAIDLAKELDSIEYAAKKAMNVQNTLLRSNKDPEKVISIINAVLAHKYKIKDSFLIGGLYLKKGEATSKLDLKAAVTDFTLALKNFGLKDSIHKADAYLKRGHAYSYLGEFVAAGDDYDAAYNYYLVLKDFDYMLYAQQGKITMFSMNGFYDLAKNEREDLISKLIQFEHTESLAIEYYNQALDYKKTGNHELQLQSLLEAKKFQNDTIKDRMFINIHSKLAEYYSLNNNLNKAKEEIDLIEPSFNQINGDRFAELSLSGAKATYLMAIGDL